MQKIGAVMSEKMPDLYEAFRDTEQKYGIDEALRQWHEMDARLAAENAYARKLLIRFFIGGFLLALIIWGIS